VSAEEDGRSGSAVATAIEFLGRGMKNMFENKNNVDN